MVIRRSPLRCGRINRGQQLIQISPAIDDSEDIDPVRPLDMDDDIIPKPRHDHLPEDDRAVGGRTEFPAGTGESFE